MNISVDQGDCLFHLVGFTDEIAKTVLECLGELGLVGVCFSGFDEYLDAVNSPNFIFPLAIFCSISEVPRARPVLQYMQAERDIGLVAIGESDEAQPEELFPFCMVIEPPYTSEKMTQCVSALLKCGIFTMEGGFICEREAPHFHPRVEGWKCPLRAVIDSSVTAL